MRAIVGLGNPGFEYERTRHNVGFRVLDILADEMGLIWKSKFNCHFASFQLEGRPCLLIKPMGFMNRSGSTVLPLLNFYKVLVRDLILVYDELELAPGVIRIRAGGSAGTHNGLRDICRHIGADNFIRLRIGIGHPRDFGLAGMDVSSWVLAEPRSPESELIETALVEAKEASLEILINGLECAQRRFNQTKSKG